MTANAAPSRTTNIKPANPLQLVNARITYRNAPIHLLEKFTFKDPSAAHRAFLESAEFRECVILQTCNRVEVFAASAEPDEKKLLAHWAHLAGLSTKEVEDSVEISRGKDVLLHLLKLASGLDSLVIGEDQIIGQVKRAFEFSRKNGYAGPNLSMVFDRAVKVGSRVRTATGINKGSVSIGSTAVNIAERHFGNLKDKKIMLIGSGEGAALVAKALSQRGVKFLVTSRTFDRARSFAETVAGTPILFEKALDTFHEIDIIFVATTAPYYLVTFDRIESAMRARKNSMMIFDLSNPRTVEDKVASLSKVRLIDMDYIAEIVEKNRRSRSKEVQSAEKIIDTEIKSVDIIMKRMKIEPAIVSVFRSVDLIRERELKKAFLKLGNRVGADESRVIEQMSYAIAEGILSTPMNNLRKEIETDEEQAEALMKLVAKLFRYEDKQDRQ
jgi:glutamyl-tRNA reductase